MPNKITTTINLDKPLKLDIQQLAEQFKHHYYSENDSVEYPETISDGTTKLLLFGEKDKDGYYWKIASELDERDLSTAIAVYLKSAINIPSAFTYFLDKISINLTDSCKVFAGAGSIKNKLWHTQSSQKMNLFDMLSSSEPHIFFMGENHSEEAGNFFHMIKSHCKKRPVVFFDECELDYLCGLIEYLHFHYLMQFVSMKMEKQPAHILNDLLHVYINFFVIYFDRIINSDTTYIYPNVAFALKTNVDIKQSLDEIKSNNILETISSFVESFVPFTLKSTTTLETVFAVINKHRELLNRFFLKLFDIMYNNFNKEFLAKLPHNVRFAKLTRNDDGTNSAFLHPDHINISRTYIWIDYIIHTCKKYFENNTSIFIRTGSNHMFDSNRFILPSKSPGIMTFLACYYVPDNYKIVPLFFAPNISEEKKEETSLNFVRAEDLSFKPYNEEVLSSSDSTASPNCNVLANSSMFSNKTYSLSQGNTNNSCTQPTYNEPHCP